MKTDNLVPIFASHEAVKLAYLFGSHAQGQAGPLSDYDFGVYLEETTDKSKMFDIRLALMAALARALKQDSVDVVVMNTTDSPELKYDVISQGKLLFEREPFRILVEPQILNEYFDFRDSLRRYGLTKA